MPSFKFLEVEFEKEPIVVDEICRYLDPGNRNPGPFRTSLKKRLRALIRADEKVGRTPWLNRSSVSTMIETAGFWAWAKSKKTLRDQLDPGRVKVFVSAPDALQGNVGKAIVAPTGYEDLLAEHHRVVEENHLLREENAKLRLERESFRSKQKAGRNYGRCGGRGKKK